MRLAGWVVAAVLILAGCGSGGGSGGGVASAGGSTLPPAAPIPTVAILVGSPSAASGVPQIAGCPIFPADNPWNQDVSAWPVHARSARYLSHMSAATGFLHPDFGADPTYGIPYVVVPGTQPGVPVSFDYADESDPGPYPIPPNPPVEGGTDATGDRHVLVLDPDHAVLYETWSSWPSGGGWHCGSGAIFHLDSNALRPDGWTSADAAGLPILPGLVRYDEAQAGEIRHALRFTVRRTQQAYVHPATHFASSSTDPDDPPMGLRVRLKASYDASGFSGTPRVVLEALKRYGMFVADNGSDWFVSGATDSRWNDAELEPLKSVPASAFEVVDSGPTLP